MLNQFNQQVSLVGLVQLVIPANLLTGDKIEKILGLKWHHLNETEKRIYVDSKALNEIMGESLDLPTPLDYTSINLIDNLTTTDREYHNYNELDKFYIA